MIRFEPGQMVYIPCKVTSGAFPHELLVTLDTKDGPVSGFVSEEILRNVRDDQAEIIAKVKETKDDTVTVWIRGHFFTTTGLAYLPQRDLMPAA